MINCTECEAHRIIPDRDPKDWFCDDDVALVCSLVKNPNRDVINVYQSRRSEYRAVEVGIRPYRVEKEALVPDWCPLGNCKDE